MSLCLLSFINSVCTAQDIFWANRLLELTEKFQFENNSAELVLGPPTVYPTNKFDEKHDPYSEGYIVHQEKGMGTKNTIVVGYPKAILAKQLIIGGIFNVGTIYSISVITFDKKEKVVYTLDQKASKSKFTTFSVFFPSSQVEGVKIVLEHKNINGWNIIKGIGLTNSDKSVELKPEPSFSKEITEKEKIGESISSSDCYEFNPKLTPDGKTLYFVKECPNQDDQEIWYSEKNEKGEWTEAKNAGKPLNNKGHNFVASISLDGRFMILGNTYKDDGTDHQDGVSISHKQDDGNWEVPKALKIPNYENLNDHANFYMSPDETVLIMAIQDKNSIGDLDLYASFYNKYTKTWSPPMNLGKDIDTPFSEEYPYLAPDGVTMYFSSKGYLGYGAHDIYMTKRLDDSWKRWTKPQNLGPMVNSKSDDKGFAITASGDHAYFNSVNFDSDMHHMDIYKINLPKILRQKLQVLISGTISSEAGNGYVRATVKVKRDNNDVVSFCTSNAKTGKYAMAVPFGETYEVQVDGINFFRKTESLVLTDSSKGIELSKDFKLRPFLDSGQVMVIRNIYFDQKSAKLLESSYPELDKVVDQLIQQPDAIIEIGGHTDNAGKPDLNKKLSYDRAKAVGAYFIEKGIRESRLSYQGYGAEKPVESNKTETGKAQNRRVEITYLSKLRY